MQENHYLVLGNGITREGIEEQNNDNILDETKDFIEYHVDNDTIDDDDNAKYRQCFYFNNSQLTYFHLTWTNGTPDLINCCTKHGQIYHDITHID